MAKRKYWDNLARNRRYGMAINREIHRASTGRGELRGMRRQHPYGKHTPTNIWWLGCRTVGELKSDGKE